MAIKLRLAKFFLGRTVPLDDNDIIPSNNLGTGGTGAGTKYLADDGTFKTVSSGGVSDGDKGDITVSSSGSVWTIDNNAVTDAKINSVDGSKVTQSASYRLVTDTEKSTWNGKEPSILAGTTGQYWRGDKTWQTLDKTAVGLSNVVNTDTTTTANISDSINKRFATEAEKTVLSNTSGTNSGDETTATIQSKRPIKTVNGNSLEGVGNVTVTASPAGSASQVQYNSAGSFAGAANVNIQNDELALPNISNPTTPTNAIKLYGKQLADKFFLTTKETNGLESFIQESLFKNSVLLIKPAGNSTTVTAIGAAALSATGTATAANVAVTNLHTQMKRIDYLITTPATNAVAGFRTGAQQYFRGTASTEGGFFFHGYWGPATGVATATNRASFGMHASQVAPSDAEPSIILNQLAMGWDSADTNIQIMSNQGTGAATKKDLGASFPVPTADRTKVYELALWCPPGSSTIWYSVTDMGTGATASGTITSPDKIPDNTVLMGPKGWMSAGGTSSVIGISFMSIHVFTRY